MCPPCCWATHSSRRRHWPMVPIFGPSCMSSCTCHFYVSPVLPVHLFSLNLHTVDSRVLIKQPWITANMSTLRAERCTLSAVLMWTEECDVDMPSEWWWRRETQAPLLRYVVHSLDKLYRTTSSTMYWHITLLWICRLDLPLFADLLYNLLRICSTVCLQLVNKSTTSRSEWSLALSDQQHLCQVCRVSEWASEWVTATINWPWNCSVFQSPWLMPAHALVTSPVHRLGTAKRRCFMIRHRRPTLSDEVRRQVRE